MLSSSPSASAVSLPKHSRAALCAAVAAASLGLPHGAIRGRRKAQRVARARQIAIYLAHVGFGLNYTHLGHTFGRDRTTIRHACARVENARDQTGFDRALELLQGALSLHADSHRLGRRAAMTGRKDVSGRKGKSAAAAPSDVERQAHRLLGALAEPGASAKPTDIPRPDLLAVSAKRKGVTLVTAHFPSAVGAYLVSQDLARWGEASGRRAMEITEAGQAKLRRAAAPALEKFQAQHRELEDVVIESHEKVTRNEAESPLAWLARRKGRDGQALIDPAAFAAGERFRRDFTLAGLQPRITSDWSSPVTGAAPGDRGTHITDLMIAARQRLNAALDALGPDFATLITDVCGS